MKLKPMNEEEEEDMQNIYIYNREIPYISQEMGSDKFERLSRDDYVSIKNQLVCEHLFGIERS